MSARQQKLLGLCHKHMTREWTLIKYKSKKYLDIYLFKLTNIQFKNL